MGMIGEKKQWKFLLFFGGLIFGLIMLRSYRLTLADDEDEFETRIYQETTSTTLVDNDGDGLLDENDSHPLTAEIYLVTDLNNNGIVDQFEK